MNKKEKISAALCLLAVMLAIVNSFFSQFTTENMQISGLESSFIVSLQDLVLGNRKDDGKNSPKNQSELAALNLQNLNSFIQTNCTVLIMNYIDWHFELLESTVKRYPLPWNKLKNCAQIGNDSLPGVTGRPLLVNFDIYVKPRGHYMYNETNGWRDYFESKVQGTIVQRPVDGVYALYRPIPVRVQRDSYSAEIEVTTCGSKAYILGAPNRFCVGHIACEDCDSSNPMDREYMKRICWLNPMHHPNCYFLAIDFPTFQDNQEDDNYCRLKKSGQQKKLRLCTSGGARYHVSFARVLSRLVQKAGSTNYRDKIHFYIYNRFPSQSLKFYEERNLTHYYSPIKEIDYEAFMRSISQCDLMLPLLHSRYVMNKDYFPMSKGGAGKVSGALSLAMGYQIPIVLNEDLYQVYKPHLHPTLSFPHNMDINNFTRAVEAAIEAVVRAKDSKCQD